MHFHHGGFRHPGAQRLRRGHVIPVAVTLGSVGNLSKEGH